MNVNKIESYITPRTTGYSAVAALGLASLSGITKSKTLRRNHKNFAYLTAVLTGVHIAQIEYYHLKYRKN